VLKFFLSKRFLLIVIVIAGFVSVFLIGLITFYLFKAQLSTFSNLPFLSQPNSEAVIINTQSSIPGYRLEVRHAQELSRVFKDWGIVGGTNFMNSGGSVEGVPVQSITIILDELLEDGNVPASVSAQMRVARSSMLLSKGKVALSLMLPKDQLGGENYNSHQLMGIILPKFYLLTHPISSLRSGGREEIERTQKVLEAKYQNFFSIIKE